MPPITLSRRGLTVAIADRSGEVRKEASKEPEMEPLQPAVRFVVNASVGHMVLG